MHKPESVLENETHKIHWDFEIQTDHPIQASWPDLALINKRKRTCHLADFAVLTDYRKQSDRYLDITRELKKLWNMRVTVIPIVAGALGTFPKGLEKRLEELEIRRRIETIQTIVAQSAGAVEYTDCTSAEG